MFWDGFAICVTVIGVGVISYLVGVRIGQNSVQRSRRVRK